MPQDPHASVIASDAEPGTEPLSWEEVRRSFDAERWYWVATTRRDGRPHVRPVLAVWAQGKVYSTTSPGARKGRNLQLQPDCSMAARVPAIDIVVEGATSWVDDRTLLEQIAAAYHGKYGWPVTITDENMNQLICARTRAHLTAPTEIHTRQGGATVRIVKVTLRDHLGGYRRGEASSLRPRRAQRPWPRPGPGAADHRHVRIDGRQLAPSR